MNPLFLKLHPNNFTVSQEKKIEQVEKGEKVEVEGFLLWV